ncbi:three prime repair exonuclease 2-like [Spodoptera frugiperda]|uniref:Three prime repair exonuclease 2-like n=1 Tax=Spodoptera frugiperda TaxID=7108 RepID=A0A9R0ELA1_SPOFR|nr:three prime repair exonuclease 2-like [Spodoptera frugiperda]
MSEQCAKPVATYVFFDLETTGLPEPKRGIIPDIIELSMVAVNRGHFLKANPDELPRAQHRLLLCFKPEKEMSKESVELSNLTNSLLDQQQPFDKNTCELINGFIKCLPRPVCLVAHNGFEFHFPILKHHMKLNGVEMEIDVNCADDKSYKLVDIYDREVQTPHLDCSRSQRQSFQAMKIALKKAEFFADWVDRNHCKFSEIPSYKI